MAKAVSNEGILLDVAQKNIDACIDRHKACLIRRINDEHEPPADGGILAIVGAIEALQNRVIARDDKAGRGLGKGDEAE